jgi:hypothetical protein
MGAGAGGEHTARGEGGGGERLGRGSDVHNCQSATCEGDGPTKTTSAPIHIPPHNHKHTRKRAAWRARSTRKAGHMPACGVCVWGCGQPKQTTSQPRQTKNKNSHFPHAASTGAHTPPRVTNTASQASVDYEYDVQRGRASSSQAATLGGGPQEGATSPSTAHPRQPPPPNGSPLPQCHSR